MDSGEGVWESNQSSILTLAAAATVERQKMQIFLVYVWGEKNKKRKRDNNKCTVSEIQHFYLNSMIELYKNIRKFFFHLFKNKIDIFSTLQDFFLRNRKLCSLFKKRLERNKSQWTLVNSYQLFLFFHALLYFLSYHKNNFFFFLRIFLHRLYVLVA